MSRRVVGIELDRSFEFPLGCGPVPFVIHMSQRQGGVGLGQSVVNLQGLGGRGLGLGPGLARRLYLVIAVDGVAISQAGIGQSVAGVLLNRLLEVLDRAFERLFGPAVPVIAALQIKLVGFGVFRGALRAALLLFGGRL